MEQTFVIVGAGLAGAKAAEALREEGFDGRVVLIGAEAERPYERPPLSKGFLLGTEENAYVHSSDWYDRHSVRLLLGQRVTGIDRDVHRVTLRGGEQLEYSKLLLTTGSMPRKLSVPGADLDGVHYLRMVGNSARLRESLRAGGRVVIIGAGWIGLETATAAREYGCPVTVVEPQSQPLLGALGERLGGFFADVHRTHGVEFRLGTSVSAIRGLDGKVTEVLTSDGTTVPADLVIIGIGARPNSELADKANLATDNGILVDETLRTEDPDIYAAGDVANAVNPFYHTRIRVEHWANALYQGPAAARSMLGDTVGYDQLPYFFTDQYDLGMEFTGWLAPDADHDIVIRGSLEGRSFHAFWLATNHVVAGMHINRWDDGIAAVDNLIRHRVPVDPARLADPLVALEDLVKEADDELTSGQRHAGPMGAVG
jgi:3-phenylpropionate/trans-cinnamate dioxygenase ferredoxin reductase subunit